MSASYAYPSFPCCGLNPKLVLQDFLGSLLFASPKDPPLPAEIPHSVTWQGADAYESDVLAFIQQLQAKIADVVLRLKTTGLLTAEEADSAGPQVEIAVWDQRNDRTAELPAITVEDPHFHFTKLTR